MYIVSIRGPVARILLFTILALFYAVAGAVPMLLVNQPSRIITPMLDAVLVHHHSKKIISIILPPKSVINSFGSLHRRRVSECPLISPHYP